MTAGELLVGIGTLALAIFTFLLVREENTARKEHIRPKFGLTGWAYVLNSEIPDSLYLKCLSGVAKDVKVEYKFDDFEVIKKYSLSLAEGEIIRLDEGFREKFVKGKSIQITVAYHYNSSYGTEVLDVNLEDINTGKFKFARAFHPEN